MIHKDIVDIYPLTPTQEGLLFHTLLAPDSGVYLIQQHSLLEGELDLAALATSWDQVVERRTILRTSFEWDGLERPLQVVHRQVHLPLVELDWSELSPDEQDSRWQRLVEEDRRQGFDLHEAPLMRFVVARLNARACRFLWTHHHLLADGWSLPLLLQEVFTLYESSRRGLPLQLPDPRPFRDYIAWLEKQDPEEAEGFWRKQLAGYREPVRLGTDRGGGAAAATFNEVSRRLSPARTARLAAFAREHQITLNTLVQAAWAFLLGRYSGRNDVVFGVTVSGRSAPIPGIESMVGPFINTLPVRTRLPDDVPVADWLAGVQSQAAALRGYEHSPLVKVQQQSDVAPGTPLFEYLLVFENYPVDISDAAALGGSVRLRDVSLAAQTNYPLMLAVVPKADLELRLSFLSHRFEPSGMERFLGHLERLLEALVANPHDLLGRISLLSDRERRQVLAEWNATDVDFGGEECLHQGFEAQVARTPEAVALVFGERSVTYAELNRQANQLAHALRSLGVRPETLVGISVPRSVEMVVGLMGILKAGGAFVPMDPDAPVERLALVFEDLGDPILVTSAAVADGFPVSEERLVLVEEPLPKHLAAQFVENPIPECGPENPAYVIYTSGSTGRPKGVVVTHRSLVNYVSYAIDRFGSVHGSGSLVHSSIAMDLGLTSLFPPLLVGKPVTLLADTDDLEALPQAIRTAEQLAPLKVTPSHLQLLKSGLAAGEVAGRVHTLVVGGEVLRPDQLRFWQEHAPETRIFNHYGPTEATIGCCTYEVDLARSFGESVPIGQPFPNMRAYVLDRHLQPQPVGVPGELYVAGVQLARGYLLRPDLTAERFVPDPFGASAGQRLYCTGDLVRWLPEGDLEFLGRRDHQVKIRGFRIELGEIEARLNEHEEIERAVVLSRQDQPGDQRLVAYFTTDAKRSAPSVESLRRHLGAHLPDYMVPQAFVQMDALPLTPNGKLDRKALPAPDGVRPELSREYVPPRTATEGVLAEVWAEILNVDQVGVHDNFFDLGGHSLLATQAISRVRARFEVDVPLRGLFEQPTVARLAELIEEARQRGAFAQLPPIEPIPRTEDLPLSFAQERLWFLDQLQPGSPFYNVPAAVRVRGKLDGDALVKSVQAIVDRHEVLRTTFPVEGGYPQQQIHEKLPIPLVEIDAKELPGEDEEQTLRDWAVKEASKPFDLAKGPLVRASLVRIAEDDLVFLWTMHHIVSDGWSTGLLFQEVASHYQAYTEGREPELPPLAVQYADYAVWQRQHLSGEELDRQLAYWKDQLAGAPQALELPTDRPRPVVQSFRGAFELFELPGELTSRLEALSMSEGTTLFMALLAAFQTLMSRYSGQQDVCVGAPIAGRNRAEIEPLIGFFVNTLVLRGDLSGDPSFRELMQRTRETTLGAYAHQDLPFEKLVDELQPRRDLARSPLFQVIFGLHNAPLPTVDAGDLSFEPIESDTATVKFDLSIAAQPYAGRVVGRWSYNSDLFDASTIQRMIEHFLNLLEAAVARPDAPLAALPLLGEEERRRVVEEWPRSGAAFPGNRCLQEWFEEQVERTPDATALVDDGVELTYAELNRRANRLAHHLRGLGVGPEDLVGLCLERSAELVVGMVAILKAGGAYLPLDPANPEERLTYMLADSGARVVVTEAARSEPLAAEGLRIVCLDTDAAEIEQEDPGNPRVRRVPESAAYVIYTSGSTGRPKGCVVTHANVVRLFTATEPWYGFDATDVWTLFHSFAFDFSVWELWGALLYGGRLVVVPHGVSRSPDAFRRLLASEGVTVLNQTPSAFLQLMEADARTGVEQALALKWVIFGGEALQPAKLTAWIQRHGECPQLINMYGITETTVHVTYFPLPAGVPQSPASLIGRPIPDLELYLLDGYLEPVPVGVPGEIYAGGGGVARGYLHRPALTAERFVPHPFSEGVGERLYRTGDQARWLPDGTLEFLGRIDQQVKIRGFRIEVGEIEATLLGHAAVREAAVLARTDEIGQARLIAYVVAEGEAPSMESLRAHLGSTLPDYMVPAAYVFLEALPLTPNGKLDRKALPDPEASRPLATAYVAPRDDLDEALAGIVAEVLRIEQVGIHDDFFSLGGDSLKGAVLINRVQERVGEIVHVAALFERPTVAGLADYLREHYPHRIATLLGEETAVHETAPSRRLDESDLATLRSLIPPSRLRAQADAHQKNPPVVFVLAPPRSGTTLLRVMLAGHSRLFAPPELELLGFNTLQERRAEFSGSRKFWLEGTIRALMALFDCDAEEAARRMDAYESEDLTTQQFHLCLQAALDGRLLVDKTPSYTLDIEILRRAERDFEGARYVHLLRHPQAMIRSFNKAHLDQIFFPYEHPFASGELAELIWTVSHQNTLQFLASVPPERQHRLRFEDLVRDPEGTMRGLCGFLKLPFEDGLLDPYSDVHSRMADGPYEESRALGDVLFREHGAIRPSVADAWKQEPTSHALGTMTQGLARRLGYPDVGPTAASARIEPVDRSGPLPLSFAQERLWFLDQLIPDNPFYNMPGAVRLRGTLDLDSVRQTIQAMVNRHETLRTTFERRDEGPVQLIASELAVDVPLLDMTDAPESEREEAVRSRIVEEAQRPFDLRHGPLFRATLFRLNDNDHILFFALHHIIGDGWSLGVLLQEVGTLYAAFARGEDSPLAELPIQYADFAQWQRQWLDGEVVDTQLNYWRQQLADLPVLALPTDRPRPAVCTFRGSTYSTELPEELSASLKNVSRQEGVTLFMTLLAGFNALMARYTGQEDIVIGSPISGRIHSDLEGLIGFFVNTLVLRTDLSGNPSFRELMHRVRDVCHAAYEHQDLPFEKLVEEFQPQRDLSREAMIQVMFQLQAAPLPDVELSDGLSVSPVEAPSEATRFDMEVYLREHAGQLHLWVVYSTELFAQSTIERLARHYRDLLQGLAAEPDRPISRLPMLSQDECRHLLCDVNDTASEFSSQQCIQELFEAQAERTPQAVALEFGETELTYAELNAQANQLAHYLRSLGVGPEVRVPVCLERGIEFIIGVLAILKAGGAYVPLDPNDPSERLEFLLHDAAGPVVVTSRTLQATRPPADAESVCLDERPQSEQPESNLHPLAPDNSLAYIIYTSGSTGRPKGVSVSHAAIRRLVMQPNYIEITADDRVAQASTTTFDAATFEIWGALLNGARLVGMPRDMMLSPPELSEHLRDRRISTLFVTTALFNECVHQVPEGFAGLRTLLFGGEAVQPDRVRKALAEGCPKRLLHVYGPTETTTFATWYQVESLDDRATTVPIGRGISETQTYLLDPHLNPVPVNVPGELYLGGEGLARGYHARSGLTAERFVPHPFSDEPGARLYRTGDLCRWTAVGQIEFIGRVDHQVKLRGFRIELGEIEDALRQHSGVREAVVTVREDTPGEKQLIGYLLGDPQYRGPDETSDEPADDEKATEAGIERWKKVYDRVIYADLGEEAREEECFNITGWISSYTGQSIGAEAMHEQVEQTVARIRACRPQRILELGCGTGLVLFPLAPECEAYWATDFSEVALDYTGRVVDAQGLQGVELRQQTADNFDGIPQGWFDAVVLNSVVQYFPSLDYLLTVLEGAVRCLRPGGFVFLGDVRNLRVLEALQASVALYQAADETDCGDLAAAVAEQVAAEQELLVDPELFLAVGERLQVFGGVEIQLKRGHHQHELTAFRYDVLLHRDPPRTATPNEVVQLDWRADDVTLEGLEACLAGSRAQRIELTGVPNARVMKSVRTACALYAEDRPPTAAQLRCALDSDEGLTGLDPEALWQLESTYPYRVAVGWSPAAVDCCDIVLSRCEETTPGTDSRRDYLAAPVEWTILRDRPLALYATEPVRGTLSRSLVPDVRRHLAATLPEYMIPAALVVLDQLPLTPSGKLDRRALPAPGGARPELDSEYVAPRNETEALLVDIWSEVLGVNRIGVHDDFFALGGHSLLATQVMSRVRQQVEIDIPLRELFQKPTVAELAVIINEARVHGVSSRLPPVVPVDRGEPLPLSFAQARLWFLEQLQPGSPFYHMLTAVRIHGALDVPALRASLETIIARHEVLRTVFVRIDGEPYQEIRDQVELPWTELDLRETDVEDRESIVRQRAMTEVRKPFDLSQGPLVRACLMQIADDEFVFVWTMHHIVSDGWTLGVLLRELGELYAAIRAGRRPRLPVLTVQYADYAAWQQQCMAGVILGEQLDYWKSQLAGVPERLELPTDRPRPQVQSFRGSHQRVELPPELMAKLESLCAAENVTVFMSLLVVLQTLLSRYSGQEDFCIGTPIAGRRAAETEPLIGFFVNTLALRCRLHGDPTFRDVLQRTRDTALGAYTHQDLPFEKLVDELGLSRDLSQNPLFQVVLGLNNAPLPKIDTGELTFSPIDETTGTAKFDISITLQQSSGRIVGKWSYNSELFEAATIRQMIAHFQALLEMMVADPGQPVFEVPLDAGQKSQVSSQDVTEEPAEFDFGGLGS